MARRRWGRGPAGGVRLRTGKGGGGRPDLVVEPAAGGGGARDREGEMGIEQEGEGIGRWRREVGNEEDGDRARSRQGRGWA